MPSNLSVSESLLLSNILRSHLSEGLNCTDRLNSIGFLYRTKAQHKHAFSRRHYCYILLGFLRGSCGSLAEWGSMTGISVHVCSNDRWN